MARIRELIMRVGVQLERKQFRDLEQQVESVRQDLMELSMAARRGFEAIKRIVGANLQVANTTGEHSAKVLSNAQAYGVSAEKFQEYLFAVRQLGGDFSDLGDIMGTVADRAIDVKEGNKTYVKEFKRFGITARQIKGMRVDEVFDLVMKRAQGMGNELERTGAVSRLFGDDVALKLNPALVDGAFSFEAYGAMAREAGVVMSADLLKKNADAQRSWQKLKSILLSFVYALGSRLLPVLSRLGDIMSKWLTKNREVLNSRLDAWVDRLSREFERAKNSVKLFIDTLGGVEGVSKFFKVMAASLGLLATIWAGFKIQSIIVAIQAFVTAVGAPLLTIVVLAIQVALRLAVVFLVVEDLIAYFRGGKSVIGGAIAYVRKEFAFLGEIFDAVMAELSTQWARLMANFDYFANGAGPGFLMLLKGLAKALAVGFVTAVSYAGTLLIGFLQIVNWIMEAINSVVAAINKFKEVYDSVREPAEAAFRAKWEGDGEGAKAFGADKAWGGPSRMRDFMAERFGRNKAFEAAAPAAFNTLMYGDKANSGSSSKNISVGKIEINQTGGNMPAKEQGEYWAAETWRHFAESVGSRED